ncbi:MAG TPA: hypothetical protein VK607_23000, partial [Kofleriaceae bacterium]|nr:hypothetical protein [Kofleriaceae bacterium]
MVDQRRIDDQCWVDAVSAASYLGISMRSLYAYMSRERIRSVPGKHGRPRLYTFTDLERRPARREVDGELAAVGGTARGDRGDRRVEHRLAPAQRTRGDRAMAGARVAADAQPLEIGECVEPGPAALAGDAPHPPAAHVGIERAHRDPEVTRRAGRIDPTLIVDSTLI